MTRSFDGRAAMFGLAALGFALAGCKEEKKAAPAPASANNAMQRVIEAAEQNMQATAAPKAKLRFRGVQAYSQAAAQRVAVCGQVSPFADDANIFVPFVTVATGQPHGDWTEYQFEHRIGTNPAEATRVYAAIVTYCYEDGGPAQAIVRGAAATPPLPDAVPDPSRPTPAAAEPAAKPATPTTTPTEASGTVTLRQAANLRSDPHGPPIKVVSQGTSMRVFGQAPGGWLQVGDTAPQGWVHDSMVERR